MTDAIQSTDTQVASDEQRQSEPLITNETLGVDFFTGEQRQAAPPSTEEQLGKEGEQKPDTQSTPAANSDWLKNFGWENEEKAKQEVEELRALKANPPKAEEQKFENEQSKTIYELLKQGKTKEVKQFLDTQERLDSVIQSEVSKDTAPNIIKLGLKLKYPTLTEDQIEFQYRQDFGVPKQPVQRTDELDEDFAERTEEWKELVQNIETKATIAATMAKPELEKAKAQLVLPEIERPDSQVQKPPTQEELDAAKKYDESFIQSAQNSVKGFNGVSVAVKNEVVEFPVSYGATEDDKKALDSLMKSFQESNYDANSMFAELWLNEDKTLKTDQMVEDYYLIKNKRSVFNKIANDSATKAIELFVKGKKNININETNQQGTAQLNQDGKTEMDKIRDKVFG